jgi:endo-1,4-beta-xylanase
MNKFSGLLVLASLSPIVVAAGCANGGAPSDEPEVTTKIAALTGTLSADFEDGTTQGWFPFGSPTVTNSTDLANTGTHSLLTTNRTSGFMGPGTSLTGQLTAAANYHVSVAARLVAGQAATGLKVTVMRSFADGTSAFDAVVTSTQVTDQAWVTLQGNYSFASSTNSSGSALSGIILYVESDSATASYYIDTFSLTQAAPPPISFDFEDGTAQGWFPFGSPTVANSTDTAFTGTHSLLTTNRTASFMGPGVNMLGKLTKGATYQVTVSARLVTGQPASTLIATFQRTPTGGSAAFDTVVSASVTDQAWVTMTGIYSFSTDNSALIFYVQTASGNASYYIDAVSIAQVAPPPGPPGNTAGASSTFESQTTEGWKSRTGGETVAVTNADAHGGSFSLLTSNRTATFQGPAFDVTNVMFNGSQYVVSLWAKLAPGQPDTQLRVSLDRKLGTATETFHQVVGNTTVTANAWVRLQATYNQALANSSLVLYVESASGTPSFYIDDFSITFVPPAVAERNIPSVYQSVAAFFPIVGAAVIPADIQQSEPAFLLSKHFNSITSGNDMKWDATEPTEGNFTFTQADAEVAFAQTNNMHVRGHTLVWHNQTPAWVFNHADGTALTNSPDDQALLTQRLQRHITTLMTHFNTVPVWDVVNEPIDESQPDGYRRSPWFNILGPQYISIALQAARAANPTAKLYINDFNTTIPAKRDFLVALVRSLKSQGVPLDGIGHQMHNNIAFPSPQSVIDAVNLFDTTGVEQAVTEMDVSIYSGSLPTPFTSYTDIPQSRHVTVGYSYLGFVQALKQVSSKIVSITIWGTSDDKSWLTSSTKVDAPLLFDPSLQKKPAYWAFVDPLQLPGADLSTAISAAPTAVPAGQAITYTITVTNNADTNQQPFDPTDDDLPATNVSLSTAVPGHTVFQAITAPAGWSCNTPPAGAAGPVQCTLASLPVGAAATFTLTVALSDCSTPDASTILASASVTSSTADPNPAPNNAASVSVQVSNSAPVITALGPLNATVECATSYVDPGATAADACQGPVPVSTASTVNTSQVGSYAVTYTVADQAGDQATPVVRTVNVTDTTPPVVSVLGANPATVECAKPFVDPGATSADSCAGALPVVTSGAVNAGVPGGYLLGYTATDPSGNVGLASRVVNVSDTTAPAIDVVDLTILAKGLTIVINNGTLTVGGLKFPLNRSVQLPVDGHTITIQGGVVTVDGLPALSGGRTIVLLPPNHDYHTFKIADLVSSVTDTCDASLGLANAVITQISSDETVNASGSGNTQNDIVIASDCRSAQLRIERVGGGNGRVYDIALHVQDPAGNRTATTVQVMVPANGLGAIDDGPHYTVTSACP